MKRMGWLLIIALIVSGVGMIESAFYLFLFNPPTSNLIGLLAIVILVSCGLVIGFIISHVQQEIAR